jgi:hypothetical protein
MPATTQLSAQANGEGNLRQHRRGAAREAPVVNLPVEYQQAGDNDGYGSYRFHAFD